MPAELVLFDVLVPGLLVIFILSTFVLWLFDWLASYYRWYHYVWHPALFRLAVFTIIFSLSGLFIIK
ncbi:DUF1656 domain-containing protein [Candidatus Nitrosacidococcus sp. I8]|uniref:DUF1656 domain-containing protein n=1 Tax=Candidatus Nitrosacidococcus sp. I8 TaxID=2942908 RepID=UPI002226D4B4|nr:DUF1656 domain-containing protein [Candidatus Nitrosacidococcus sp. I8]CAH9018018.1 hypothetical protein NURINAE_00681 [Candidatus Nitrosacidococcus sp. I8]